jgi:transcriptional regulator with GAF, ATPase, and Fis domain
MKSGSPSNNPHGELLERQISRNWYVLCAVAILSTVGMAIAVAPVVADRVGAVWPWGNTYVVLLCGLVASVAMFVAHLTYQQRKVGEIRARVSRMERETADRERHNDARLRALLNISRMMGAVTDPENVFQSVTQTCLEIFECQQASLMLLTEGADELVVKAATGHRTDVTGAKQSVDTGIAGWVARTQKPLILNPDTDLSQYPGLQLRGGGLCAAMVVPILVRDQLVGILNASSRVAGTRYTEEDVSSLSVFAQNVGTVIRHSEQAVWMRATIDRLRSQLERAQAQGAHTGQPT